MDPQTALSATACSEIWVSQGIYRPTAGLDPTVSFEIRPGVAVYGGFVGTETSRTQRKPHVHATILTGDLAGDDSNTNGVVLNALDIVGTNSYHVIVFDGTTPSGSISQTTVLDGFTVTGGHATSFGGRLFDYNGGGIYCNGLGDGHSCSPTINDVILSGNGALNEAGAFSCEGALGGTCSPTISNTTFTGNRAGENGTGGYGGAMLNDGYSGTSNPTLIGVTFQNNTATTSAGAIYNNGQNGGQSNPILANVTLSGNVATAGGAMVNDGSGGYCVPTLTNVTFTQNSALGFAAGFGGAMFNYGTGGTSNPQLVNVILWGNSATRTSEVEIANHSATTSLAYSVIQGGCPIGSTCDAQTVFSDPKLGPLQDNGGPTLTIVPGAGSALDSGSDAACASPPVGGFDQRGVRRPQGAHCDIGAVEVAAVQPATVVPAPILDWWAALILGCGLASSCHWAPVRASHNNGVRDKFFFGS